MSQQDLAAKIGVTQQSIQAIESGKVRKPRFLIELAEALTTSAAHLEKENPGVIPETLPLSSEDFLVQQEAMNDGVHFAGKVESGSFRRIELYPQVTIGRAPLALDIRFLNLPQFAWFVSGDGMDGMNIQHGMLVLAALYQQYKEKYGPVKSGAVVVVERSRHSDKEREVSLKQVRYDGGNIILSPKSSNPHHETFGIGSRGECLTVNFNGNSQTLVPSRDHVELVAVVLSYHQLLEA